MSFILLSTIYNLENFNQFGTQEAIPFIPIVIGMLIAAAMGYGIKLYFFPSKKTKKIAILGAVASGKTTLWNKLRDQVCPEHDSNNYEGPIDKFDISIDGRTVSICATKDIVGTDDWVQDYESVIQEGTFIYYLVDLTRLKETKREIRSRLQKISKIIKEKKYKDCGLKIIATHYDEYSNNIGYPSREDAAGEVKLVIDAKSIKDFDIDIDDRVIAVNLLNTSDIETIKREIINKNNKENNK